MRTRAMMTGSSRVAGQFLGRAIGLMDVLRKVVQQGRNAARRRVERARTTWEDMDVLRKAEQQGRDAARRSWERARDIWDDNERRLRRKMRIYPRSNPRAPRDAGIGSAALGFDSASPTNNARTGGR
jgi:hypothetical protein